MIEPGHVIFVSANGAMIVVQHDDGYAVVELIGDEGELQPGADVRGDWSGLGHEPLSGGDPPRDFHAYFQGSWGSRDAAIRIARNTGGG